MASLCENRCTRKVRFHMICWVACALLLAKTSGRSASVFGIGLYRFAYHRKAPHPAR